ncbi:hypothetical protein [Streptomyces pinistramenti]|uniref:hypothetical protein n=1 Tax=Streptomyces pinistramenti TaxID=2884812 RepID=UPI001D0829AC|nr:hypothetical protein [Streptomyces pinistramenti]MCB5910346.1 hypothetical protein [Streptomyces pinistramenti]
MNLKRFAIDDGRHFPSIVITEGAPTAEGTARYAAHCSCGHVPATVSDTEREAITTHIAHVKTRLGPSRGPAWMPVGVRLTLLVAVGLALVGGAVIGTQILGAHLDGAAVYVVRGAGPLLGFAAMGILMVATRHYIAPTRA